MPSVSILVEGMVRSMTGPRPAADGRAGGSAAHSSAEEKMGHAWIRGDQADQPFRHSWATGVRQGPRQVVRHPHRNRDRRAWPPFKWGTA